MAYQIFPTPATTTLPPGADSIVVKGAASKGGFTWTSSLDAGVYMVNANGPSNAQFALVANNSATLMESGQYNYIVLNTAQTNFTVGKTYPFEIKYRTPYNTQNSPGNGKTPIYMDTANVVYQFVMTSGATSTQPFLVTSTDYINWTTRFVWTTMASGYGVDAAITAGNNFIVVSPGTSQNVTVVSTNGINWSTVTTMPSAGNGTITKYYNGYFWNHGSNVGGKYSTDLVNWTSTNRATIAESGQLSLAMGPIGHLYVCNSNSGSALSGYNSAFFSTNGTTWSSRITPLPTQTLGTTGLYFSSAAYGNGKFVIVGSSANARTNRITIWNSTNGVTWSYVQPFSSTQGADSFISYANGIFYLGVNDGTLSGTMIYSPDGVNWSTRTAPGIYNAAEFINANGKTMGIYSDNVNNAGYFNIVATQDYGYFELYKMSTASIN